jgi:hypothetical protein
MALVISAVQVTGTATAYTVPVGKVAKVRLVNVDTLATAKKLTIGNYVALNSTGQTVKTESQGQTTGGASVIAPAVAGFVRAASGATMTERFMYIKEDHILVAGQTVSCDDTGATISYTIFQEDA